MHEVGLACDIVQVVKNIASESGCHHVAEVVLEVGECSGIMVPALKMGLDAAAKTERVTRRTVFSIEEVPGKITCLSCGDVSGAQTFSQPCPRCGSLDRKITDGRELTVKSLKAR